MFLRVCIVCLNEPLPSGLQRLCVLNDFKKGNKQICFPEKHSSMKAKTRATI